MYKNLSPQSLGLSGRQSELIELALTYGFKGFDVDINDLLRRAEQHGAQPSMRFIQSARIRIGGFELPVRWQGSETEYKADLAGLAKLGEVVSFAESARAYTYVLPASDDRPYHENFDLHRERLSETGDHLAQYNVRLAVGFLAPKSYGEGHEYPFIQETEAMLALMKSITSTNVGLLLDTWHWQVGKGGIDQIRELTAEQIAIVRLADVPQDADIAAIDEDQRLLPGESESTYATDLLRMLSEQEYDGPISPYPSARSFSGMTRDAIVQKTAQAIDDQWKAAGLTKSGRVVVTVGS